MFPDTHACMCTLTRAGKRAPNEPIHLLRDEECCLATLAPLKSSIRSTFLPDV